jgi:hypothetical protein
VELVNEEIVIGEPPLPVSPPGLETAMKVETTFPPLLLAVKVTDAEAFPADAVPIVGA